jgi:methylmalonyl-CoA/ethylmalonyl-CoA epimerase
MDLNKKGTTVGIGGVSYEISQISLVVRDLDKTMRSYHKVFGWGPWTVFEHVPPMHHDTELRGKKVHYTLLGAETMVGSVNFELLQPLEGPSLWQEFLDKHGEGIASIAVMFKTREESEKVKAAFKELGIEVIMRASIGDHIEYYYLDTEPMLKCSIESGSGHAIDFIKPKYVYP